MSSENLPLTKMSGYLEKKGRKKMMSCYKKYWFVLEGRLLLYYKSKDEYDAISPCKGSISLGATCNVKPCTSNIGVFQIENKTTTITLRAETRVLQHQWMHAIMSALNQGPNGNRLSHFRYSLGELSKSQLKEKQEDDPIDLQRQNSSTRNESKLIEKLRRQGAQACGIGAIQLQNRAIRAKQGKSLSHESLAVKTQYMRSKSQPTTKNQICVSDEYDRLNFNTDRIGSCESISDAIYEQVKSDDSIFLKRNNNKSLNKVSDDNELYCGIIEDWLDDSLNKNNKTTKSEEVLDINPVYGLQDRCKRNLKILRHNWRSTSENERSFMTDNDCYWSMHQKKNKSHKIDCNDNTIKSVNPRTSLSNISVKSAENMYYEASQENNNEDLVEYVDITYTELNNTEKKECKKKRRFSSFYRKNKTPKEKSERKVIKTESFLQRVFVKNKKKLHTTSNSLDETTKTEPLSPVENNIRIPKKVQDKLHSDLTADNDDDQDQEMIYDEVITETTNDKQNKTDEPLCPLLPPRNNRKKRLVKDASQTRTQEIDDILEDLNKESPRSNTDDDEEPGNVKKLIKRFSMERNDNVEIRVKKNWDRRSGKTSSTDSNELNKLLDELAKVTTAPIMTPGVTTSLINPEITDAELMNIIPTRNRRLSEPDYDIPRPHRSLTNIQKKDSNALQATRFFGPILNSCNLENDRKRPPTPPVDYTSVPSITPDSLEVAYRKSHSHYEDPNSYHSHEYLNYRKRSHSHIDLIVENNLYDDPRLLHKVQPGFQLVNGEGARKSNSSHHEMENNFIDSLET